MLKGVTLTEFLIGAGGWAYFRVPGLDPLVAYSRVFGFVEVNSTFYEVPSLKTVASWRRRVPPNFEFTVRCHRELTHRYRLEPVEQAYKILEKMLTICETLKAGIMHMQTPPTFKFNEGKIKSIRDFFNSVNLREVRLAWEVRRTEAKLPLSLIKLMQDLNITHCVDLSREEPAFPSDVLYTRLFGKGVHNLYQFTDEELKEIDEKATRGEHEKVILCFHGVKMYKDAARFKFYKQTDRFPEVTSSTGLGSLKEVLSEDAHFPCTKAQLVQRQGWKVIDLTSDRRVHASELLAKIPEQSYRSIDEVIQAVRQVAVKDDYHENP